MPLAHFRISCEKRYVKALARFVAGSTLVLVGCSDAENGKRPGGDLISDAGGTSQDASRSGSNMLRDAENVSIDAAQGSSSSAMCPDAGLTIQDGMWEVEAVASKSGCAEHSVGDASDRFSTVTIVTTKYPNRRGSDLRMTTVGGEAFRGNVFDDRAILWGPLGAELLNVDLQVLFSGPCFTAHVTEELAAPAGTCEVDWKLMGTKVGELSD